MNYTMEHYYDNLKKHGFDKSDLPMLAEKSAEQYNQILSQFNGWNNIFIDGSNQICIQTEEYKQKCLYLFEKNGEYRALILYYEFYLPDDGNYFTVNHEIIELQNDNERDGLIKLWQ